MTIQMGRKREETRREGEAIEPNRRTSKYLDKRRDLDSIRSSHSFARSLLFFLFLFLFLFVFLTHFFCSCF